MLHCFLVYNYFCNHSCNTLTPVMFLDNSLSGLKAVKYHRFTLFQASSIEPRSLNQHSLSNFHSSPIQTNQHMQKILNKFCQRLSSYRKPIILVMVSICINKIQDCWFALYYELLSTEKKPS